VPYLQARFTAIPAVGCNFAFRGYWNGVNLSRLYMRTLVVMHAANIFLNWVLIYGNLGAPRLGATGAGVSNAIATYIGTGYYLWLGLRHARGSGFLRELPDRKTTRTMLRLAIPAGLQQLFFSGGLTALFIIIARVGKAETAAANVLVQIMLVAVLPAIGLGIGSASLVGQALGRKDPTDAARWAWEVARVGVALLFLLGLPMVLVPDLVLVGFIKNASTLDLARTPLRIVGATIFLDGIGLVLWQSLLGAGASRLVMMVSTSLQWGLFLPAAFLIGPVLGYGLLGVWTAQVAHRVLQAVVYAVLWRRGSWQTIEV
jgi:putative MATE family efflux protein